MSNVNFGPSQGDITAFQSVMMLSQEYTQVAKNPALADQANEMLTQILTGLQAIGADDPTLLGSIFGQPASVATSTLNSLVSAGVSSAALMNVVPLINSNSASVIASDPTLAPTGYTPPTTIPPPTPITYNPNPAPPAGPPGTTPPPVPGQPPPPTTIPPPTPTPPSTPTTPTGPGLTATLDAWAQSVGLGALSGWITDQAQTLTGQGLSASDVISVISSTINTAPGFDAIMPGYNQRIKNGFSNTDANTGAGIAGYLAYRQQLQAMAETAGMIPGTVSPQIIGNAWAGDVSTTEMSERITTEYTNAVNALPQVQAELQNYGYTAGISAGQLASMYLNPANTVAQLQQQFNSAVVGGEGVLTGFGEIGKSQAYALQAFLSNQGQNNLTTGQAAGFFGGSIGGGLSSLAVMAQTGFEAPQLGTAPTGPGVVDQASLIGAGEGNAADLLRVQRAAQTRAAPSQGGGGLEASQTGVGGVGFGSQ